MTPSETQIADVRRSRVVTAVLLRAQETKVRSRGSVCVRATFRPTKGEKWREEVVPKQDNCHWARPTTEFGAVVLSVRKFREGRNASASEPFGSSAYIGLHCRPRRCGLIFIFLLIEIR